MYFGQHGKMHVSIHTPCNPNQINALASINQCTENVQLLPTMPTSNIHASPPLTHRDVSLVSLPMGSTLPDNSLSFRFLGVVCAQHGQTCAHANNMPATSLCLRIQPNTSARQCTYNFRLLCSQMRKTQPLFRLTELSGWRACRWPRHFRRTCSRSVF